jgi:hypothetical protein
MENPSSLSTEEVHNFLVRRLGEKEAAEIMEYIQSEIDRQVAGQSEETRLEIDRWRNELKDNFATRQDAVDLQTKLVKRVSRVEGTIILWAFVFWFPLILAMYIIFKFIQ